MNRIKVRKYSDLDEYNLHDLYVLKDQGEITEEEMEAILDRRELGPFTVKEKIGAVAIALVMTGWFCWLFGLVTID